MTVWVHLDYPGHCVTEVAGVFTDEAVARMAANDWGDVIEVQVDDPEAIAQAARYALNKVKRAQRLLGAAKNPKIIQKHQATIDQCSKFIAMWGVRDK